ncbi:MAG: carboxypeptidase regulatory-like domain-containing protein [Thermodesulfobacteriota bacterium]|nr:carboxypeptidase regulatory-like domain-containing protein [Thermodesulfobacteriota bacterium]
MKRVNRTIGIVLGALSLFLSPLPTVTGGFTGLSAAYEGPGYATVINSWDFEGPDPTDGWVGQLRLGSGLPDGAYWHKDSFDGYNSTDSWWCGVTEGIKYDGYANNWLQFLETPVLDLTTTGSTLTFSFMMNLYCEGGAYHPMYDSWDGANVWYSTDAGATWQVLTGPSLAYNSSSNFAFGDDFGYYYDQDGIVTGSPVPVWHGNATGNNYVPVSFDVSFLIDEPEVKFRFGFASDASESAQNYSAYKGMHVDDIVVSDDIGGVFLNNNADGTAIPSELIPIFQHDSQWALTETSAYSQTHAWHIPNDPNLKHQVVSPLFFVPNRNNLPVYLSYYVWCDLPDVNSHGGSLDDYYEVWVSINNGASWFTLGQDWAERPVPGDLALEGWVYRNTIDDSGTRLLDLSKYRGYNVNIGFRAITDFDEDDGVGTGLYIDDVSVFQYEGFYDYTWGPVAYNWIEIADDPEAQFLAFTHQSHRRSIDMPRTHRFQFPYYGSILNTLSFGAGGLLYQSGGTPDYPASLHDASSNNGVMAPFRTPMTFTRENAGVYVKNVENMLVTEWFVPSLADGSGWPLTFQAHLYPDGTIEYHYQIVPPSIEEVSPLTIGISDVDRDPVTELYPELGFVPADGTAVLFIPQVFEYGVLELTIVDEVTGEAVSNMEVYLPQFDRYGTTDVNGAVIFDFIPIHYGATIEVQITQDYYTHEPFQVTLSPETTVQATMPVISLLNPVQNTRFDNQYDNQIEIAWDPPAWVAAATGQSGNGALLMALDPFAGNVAYYNIYRDGALHHSTPNGTTLSFMDTGLDETVIYTYRISAVYTYDSQQIEGPLSDPMPASPVMAPGRPDGTGGLLVENETTLGGDITLTWTAPTTNADGTPIDDLAGYNLYLNGALDVPETTVAHTETSLTLPCSQRGYYNWYITAFDNAGHESLPWVYGYNMVGLPDEWVDFETVDQGFQSDGFEWGAPAAGTVVGFDGSANAWGTRLAGYYENETLYTLYTRPLHVGPENCWVTFQQWHDFESGYDGGLVAVSTDNGNTWEVVDLAPDGSLYDEPYLGGPYNNPLSDIFSETTGVITGFSGDAPGADGDGWYRRGVNLDAYAGMDILLGFMAGSDAANHMYYGWYLDHFGLYNVTFLQIGSITGVVTDSTTGLPLEGATMTIPGEEVTAGSNGRYTFHDLPAGEYNMTASFQDLDDITAVVTVVDRATTTQDFQFTAYETPTDIHLTSTTVDENQPVGTVVGTFSTDDANGGDTHTYSFVSGTGDDDNASFVIDGNVLKTAAVFDYETKASYAIRVRSEDNMGLIYDEEFTITVDKSFYMGPIFLLLLDEEGAETKSSGLDLSY